MFEKKILIQQRLRIRSQHALPTKSLILAKNLTQITTNTQHQDKIEISQLQFNEDTNVHKRQNLAGNIQTDRFYYRQKTTNKNVSKFTAAFPNTFQTERFKSSNYISTGTDNEQIMSDHAKKVANSKHNLRNTRSRRIISQHRNSDKSSSSNSKKSSHRDKNLELLEKTFAHRYSLRPFQDIKVVKSFDEEIDMFFDEMFNFGQKQEVKKTLPQQKHCLKHKQECERHETTMKNQKIEKDSYKLVIIVLILCSTLAIIQILY